MRERPLDELLPILQNLGLRVVDQVQFKITLEAERGFIRSLLVEPGIEGVGAKQVLRALDVLLAQKRSALTLRITRRPCSM